jgi:CheY-like chemotaxis protein
VFEAESGEKALELASTTAFDLVLLDVNMPGLDGYETARRLRADVSAHPRPAIVGLTADAAEDARLRCLEAGMDEHASKPLDVMKLLSAIDLALSARSSDYEATASEPPKRSVHSAT